MKSQTKTIRPVLKTDLQQFEPKRVAVYTRVSREGEEKHHSIVMQKENLKDEIEKHPNWQFAGFYVDEGVTGTKLDRPAFNRLLSDSRSGKIDIILTKTMSRLGRNTAAVHRTLQELLELGVEVIFDDENISTADPDSFFYLHFLGIQAEAEAKQTSDNLCWSKRNRFKEGIPTYTRPFGYQMIKNKFYIVPEEAGVIKRIFNMYLSGMGKEAISKTLNTEGVPSPKGFRWRSNTISRILNNVKYTGDMLLQKYYVADFLNKVYKLNRGELPQYFIENTHEPIIDKEIFIRVQDERERRFALYNSKSNGEDPSQGENRLFAKLIKCPHCGTNLYFKRFSRKGTYRDTWACDTHIKQGASFCPTKSIREYILIDITKEVLIERGLIKEETELTQDLLKLHLQEITVPSDHTLEYHFQSGEIVTKTWRYPSRSKSWTEEMKEQARQKTLARQRK